jgi:hypothetical protein
VRGVQAAAEIKTGVKPTMRAGIRHLVTPDRARLPALYFISAFCLRPGAAETSIPASSHAVLI